MTNRPQRSHVRYAMTTMPIGRPRARPARVGGFVTTPRSAPPTSDVAIGLAHALPVAMALWAVIIVTAHSIF